MRGFIERHGQAMRLVFDEQSRTFAEIPVDAAAMQAGQPEEAGAEAHPIRVQVANSAKADAPGKIGSRIRYVAGKLAMTRLMGLRSR